MNPSRKCIIQVTPEATPAIGGVASYAENIQKELQHQQIENYTVSFSGTEVATGTYFSNCDTAIFEQHINQLLIQLKNKECVILLHYVSYGYDKNGLPFYLTSIIKRVTPQIKVITLFHEIGADGPIWSKAFWTARLQKNIAKQLAVRSDRLITTTAWYQEILEQWVGHSKNVTLAPVFSNMGEPTIRISMAERKKMIVIFGGKALKEKLYQNYLQDILALKASYQIAEIIDIGLALDSAFYKTTGIQSLGICTDEVVSSYLSNAWLGVMHYDLRTIDKSGVHAAYQAHGLPTVIFTKEYIELLPAFNISGDDSAIYSETELEALSIQQVHYYYTHRSISSLVKNIL